MKLRRIRVENYRGIRSLDWSFDSAMIFLVGAGDNTKTTILDAISAALSARYNLTFTDADFYNCDTASAIKIEVALVDLPEAILTEQRHGKNRSGIHRNGEYEHDPLDDSEVEECLIVQLFVDASLEPVWSVVRPNSDESARITASERAMLGFFRMGDFSDSHLRWSRGSALSSLTSARTETSHAVIEAQRGARGAVFDLDETPLHAAAKLAGDEARKLGGPPFAALRPGLDPGLISGAGSLVLHEGSIPLTYFGLGSRRLTSLAIQENASTDRSVVAIDEIEHGLEPHRITHLLRYLRSRGESSDLQVLLTTHSPIAVESLSPNDVFIVRSTNGETTVQQIAIDVPDKEKEGVQSLLRSQPSALLARTLIVGEGATEVGFLRALLKNWDERRLSPTDFTAVTTGVSVVNGAGDSTAPVRAAALAQLGYPTALLIDGDVTTNSGAITHAESKGVALFRWSDGKALEDVIVQGISLVGLQALVDLACDEVSPEAVMAQIAARLQVKKLETTSLTDWLGHHEERAVRAAIAGGAKGLNDKEGKKSEGKAWFKREDRGERLANLVLDYRADFTSTELGTTLGELRRFAYREADALKAANDKEADDKEAKKDKAST